MIKQLLNVTICALPLLLGSCAFLEVDEKGVVSETKMFKDVAGFEAAMYGVYSSMGNTSLYGEALSHGFIEEVCYQYQNVSNEALKKVMAHDYLASEVRPTIDNIWNTSYQTLSYINNVIKFTDNGVLKDEAYANIKGEALGLRAYIHFDILRLFAKTYSHGDESGVPYQTEFSSKVPPTSTIKKSCELIVEDLLAAEMLLDPYIGNFDRGSKYDYTKDRHIHFNIYAIKATLARVYLYMGKNDLAAKKALEVITSKRYTLLQKTEINGVTCFFPNGQEAIFGIYKKDIYSLLYSTFVNDSGKGDAATSLRWLNQLAIGKLYEVSSFTDSHTDYRYTSYFEMAASNKFLLLKRFGKLKYDSSIDLSKVAQGITLIQIPEMYYIYAEAIYDEDKAKALEYFNVLINSRGLRKIDELKPIASKEEFMEALYNERRKEYYGTGMMFFESKRLNKSLIDHDYNVVAGSDNIYVLPWTEQEKEYGTANE